MTNSDACVDVRGIPDSLRLDIRCPLPTKEVTELTVTCGETRLYVTRARIPSNPPDRDWAVFIDRVNAHDRRYNLTCPKQLTYDEAVSRATTMADERERGRLWRAELDKKIGEAPDEY